MNLAPELIPFEFSLIHHLEKERERAWKNQNKKFFMAMAGGMILIFFFRILLITCISFVVCNITG